MPMRSVLRCTLFLLCAALAADAFAARRSVRIDFGGAWTDFSAAPDIPSQACTGTYGNGQRILRDGHEFAGYDNPSYLVDAYCQFTNPGAFDASDVAGDEPGIAELVGDNADDHARGVRYTYADGPATDPASNRFQWTFYIFDNGVSIVALYGLVDDFGVETPITNATSFIKRGTTLEWGGAEGLDDDYFCFVDGEFVGMWSGDTGEAGECMARFATFFEDGFESP